MISNLNFQWKHVLYKNISYFYFATGLGNGKSWLIICDELLNRYFLPEEILKIFIS